LGTDCGCSGELGAVGRFEVLLLAERRLKEMAQDGYIEL